MTANEFNISWDKDNDVVRVLKFGIAEEAVSNIQVNSDIVMRVVKNPEDHTKEVVGFIIDDFSVVCSEWKDSDTYHLMEEFDDIIKVLNDECARKLTSAASEAASAC